jgi:hypothetical protein
MWCSELCLFFDPEDGPSEISLDFHRPTRRYILKNNIIHNSRCNNLKPYMDELADVLLDPSIKLKVYFFE